MKPIMYARNLLQGLLPLLLMGLLSDASAVMAAPVSDKDLETLSNGQVLVQETSVNQPGKLPSVQAKILIPRPPERVWPVVSDPKKLMAREQKVKQVKVLSKTGNTQDVEFTVLMARMFPAFNYILRQELAPPRTVSFRRVRGSFKDIEGSWQLQPVADGKQTVLTYTLKLDPGPLIPRGLLLNAVKSDLPVMMRNARNAILGP